MGNEKVENMDNVKNGKSVQNEKVENITDVEIVVNVVILGTKYVENVGMSKM